jgi:hypothetical protein
MTTTTTDKYIDSLTDEVRDDPLIHEPGSQREMKTVLLFGLLVLLVAFMLIVLVKLNPSTILATNRSALLGETPQLDLLPSSTTTTGVVTAPRYHCNRQCAWKQDEKTRQFLETNQDPSNSLQHSVLSTEGYGRLADLALGYHLSPTESELLQNISLIQECLPQRVLIIYFLTDKPQSLSFRQMEFILNLTLPHVVIGNGWGNVWKRSLERSIINNPYLLRWYGSSQERSQETVMESAFHQKAYPLPLGLVAPINRFEQVKPMVQVNQELKQSRAETIGQPDLGRTKLVLINFSTGSDKAVHRQEAYDLFCNTSHPTHDRKLWSGDNTTTTTTCARGGFYDRNVPGRRRRYFADEWNNMAPSVYHDWADHKYTVNPRGQQKDCHRFWEAMYLGSVPIVLQKEGYYQDLIDHYFQLPEEEVPILFVQQWRHATPKLLEEMWNTRFVHLLRKPEWQWPQQMLTTDYVQDLIVRGVREELQQRNDTIALRLREMVPDPSRLFENRRRCYAARQDTTT